MNQRTIKIGTRGSLLARAQTDLVLSALRANFSDQTFIEEVLVTQGCQKQSAGEGVQRDKRDWIHELEIGLLNSEIDIAVHSGKDVPVDIAEGTMLLPVLNRESERDVFIGRSDPTQPASWINLPAGSVVGTSSPRRLAQLLHARPDLKIVPHRGNINTRLEKFEASTELSGIVLAAAGLQRISALPARSEFFDLNQMLPAVNQGILAVQFRKSDLLIAELLEKISSPKLQAIFQAERLVVAALGADCHSAMASFADIQGGQLRLRARVLAVDGSALVQTERTAAIDHYQQLAAAVTEDLIAKGALKLLEQAREK